MPGPLSAVRALGVAVGLLALAASASAQERKKPGRYKVGPLYVTPRLEVRNAGVDTNVFQTLTDEVRDTVLIVSPRLDGGMVVGRRLRLSGYGLLDLNYYRTQGNEGSTDFFGGGDAELDLGPFMLLGGGGGGQASQRFSIDIDERLLRQEKYAYGGIAWRARERLSFRVVGRTEVVKFAPGVFRLGGFVQEAMDRNTLSARGEVRYALTNRTALLASAEGFEDRFFSQPTDSPHRVRDSFRYLAGFEFERPALLSGRLLAGVRDFSGPLAQGSPSYTGPAILADLVLPIRNRARLHGSALRDVRHASSLVDIDDLRYRNAFVASSYQGDMSFDLPLELVGIVSGGFEEARYLLPYPFPDPHHLAKRTDHRWTAGAGLLRRFGDQVRVGGHVDWARRVSTIPFFSYQGLRFGLTAEVLP
ncbi:MAG TPA: outer membrane beta-barrel protein [Vicinamibacteria bacterium]|nr:outer membrane beta-barrel protein [Vicinamibacteria bacterium]